MKIRTKVFTSIIALVLSAVLLFVAVAASNNTGKTVIADTPTRTVALTESSIDAQSILDEFDDATLTTEGDVTTFVGYKKFDMTLFEEIDNINSTNADTEYSNFQFVTSLNEQTNEVVLKVISVDNDESIIDTMIGTMIIDEEGNFDVVFESDGEMILLSELSDVSIIEECGFFSNLWSNVKKVWNTTAGKIGTIVTVAACAVVGVVCAVVPCGTLLAAGLIGAAVGTVGGAATAIAATWIKDGKVDWEAVLCYAGVGMVAGSATSVLSYKISCKFFTKKTMSSILKSADQNPTSNTTYIGKYINNSSSSYESVAKTNGGNYFNLSNYDKLVKKYGSDAMEEVNKNFIVTKYSAGNQIISTTNPNLATGAFAKEIQWLKELGGVSWKKIGTNLWKLVR